MRIIGRAKMLKKAWIMPALAALALISAGASAAGSEVKTDGNMVSAELPVQDENAGALFDFILDPQCLVYETDAIRYGGGKVEKGATLLFSNREGEYRFSGKSDRLAVTNRGSNPVKITVAAKISGLGQISLWEDADFADSRDCSIYLALTDSGGNEVPLSADREAVITHEISSGVYYFGLTGACNANASWEYVSACPAVDVTWRVEPAISVSAASESNEQESDIESETSETGTETESETEIQTETETKIETEIKKETGIETKTETETEIKTESEKIIENEAVQSRKEAPAGTAAEIAAAQTDGGGQKSE